MNNVNGIKASHLCYGCGTCNVICGHQAITMQYDNIGRLLPMIDEIKCTNCGLCYNHCPSLDLKGIQLPETEDKYIGHVEQVFIGKATDERIYKNSQSGGLVTATLKFLFESGKIDAAIVCRVEDTIEYTSRAVVITSPEELYNCQKSSYVPIDIVSAMKQVGQFQSLAVVGTGCHIQGIRALQNFNKKYNEKIKYTLGLICDRTLCKTVTDVLYGNNFKSVAKRLVWRDKTLNYKNARILITTIDKRKKQVPTWKRHALKDPFTNPRCRICFDKLNTGADIVYGDPWGMSNVDWERGMSVVITRTQNGEGIVNQMIHCRIANLSETQMEEVISGQHIEKRKNDVSAALAFYQENKFLTPSYTFNLNPSKENSALSILIDQFIEDCSKSKKDVISQNIKYLKIKRLKIIFRKIIRIPISVIRK